MLKSYGRKRLRNVRLAGKVSEVGKPVIVELSVNGLAVRRCVAGTSSRASPGGGVPRVSLSLTWGPTVHTAQGPQYPCSFPQDFHIHKAHG